MGKRALCPLLLFDFFEFRILFFLFFDQYKQNALNFFNVCCAFEKDALSLEAGIKIDCVRANNFVTQSPYFPTMIFKSNGFGAANAYCAFRKDAKKPFFPDAHFHL